MLCYVVVGVGCDAVVAAAMCAAPADTEEATAIPYGGSNWPACCVQSLDWTAMSDNVLCCVLSRHTWEFYKQSSLGFFADRTLAPILLFINVVMYPDVLLCRYT